MARKAVVWTPALCFAKINEAREALDAKTTIDGLLIHIPDGTKGREKIVETANDQVDIARRRIVSVVDCLLRSGAIFNNNLDTIEKFVLMVLDGKSQDEKLITVEIENDD